MADTYGDDRYPDLTVATTVANPRARTEPRGNPIATLIAAKAVAHGVPVQLAQAVIRVESNFNAGLTGRAGEVGLMQIKYATARGLGYTGSRQALYDPATNLEWGMRYLAAARTLAGGDVCRTVMKYQGGHGVRRMNRAANVYCSKVKTIIASR